MKFYPFLFFLLGCSVAGAEVRVEEQVTPSMVVASGYESAQIVGQEVRFTGEPKLTKRPEVRRHLVSIGPNDGLLEVSREVEVAGFTFWAESGTHSLTPDGDKFIFTGEPGRYRITAVDFAAKSKSEQFIAVGEVEPAPDPEPDPEPSLEWRNGWIVIVEESANRDARTAKILQDASFWKRAKEQKNLDKWVYDKDAPNLAKNREKIDSVPLPSVWFVDQNREWHLGAELPQTVEDLEKLIGTTPAAPTPAKPAIPPQK